MEKTNTVSWTRIIFGGLLLTILAMWHYMYLSGATTPNGGTVFLIILAIFVFMSYRKEKDELKHFQYKTASILSFLLPISSIVYGFVVTTQFVSESANEMEAAGGAIGGAIGGAFVVMITFVIGLMLGIVFHLKTKK